MENFRQNEPIKSGEIAWSATFAVAGAVVSVLNALGLYKFITTAALRTRKHVMIINLIVTGLLFGAAGMSSTVYYLLKPSDIAFYVFLILNIFPKAASFFTLGVIAVERMHTIVWPIRHHVLGNSVYRAALVFVWVLAAVVTTFETLVLTVNEEKISMHGFGVLFFGIVTSIAACYISIWFSVRRRKRRKLGVPDDQDKALAFTLLLIAGTFLATWVIPMFYMSISRMCKGCHQVSFTALIWLRLIFAVQSVINPVIYCFQLPVFKERLKAYVQKVKCFHESCENEERERMHTIVWPIRHHVLGNSVYRAALVFVWVLAAVVTTFETLVLTVNEEKISMHGFGVLFFGIVTSIAACYISIWFSVRRRKRRKLGAPDDQDKALALTLLLIAGTFLATWVIPMLYMSISRMCKGCHQVSFTVLIWLRLIFAVQSVINPVIYCFQLPVFKERLKAYVQKVKCFHESYQQPTGGDQITRSCRKESSNLASAL